MNKSITLLLCLLALTARAGAEPARYELKLAHGALAWTAGQGLAVSYEGTPLFAPYAQEVTLHTRDWQRGLFRSGDAVPQASLARKGRSQVLTLRFAADGFQGVQTISAGPGDRFCIEWRCRQDAWDDCVMQLGLPHPSSRLLVGSTFRARVGGKNVEGTIPEQAPQKTANPFTGADEVLLSSIWGTVQARASRPLTLYDYAARRNPFFLGLDEPLPRGREVVFALDVELKPAQIEREGLTLSAFQLPSGVEDGVLRGGLRLARRGRGTEMVRVALIGTAPDGTPLREEQLVGVTSRPAAVGLQAPLRRPGSGQCALVVTNADGKELFRTPMLPVEVAPLLSVLPGRSLYTAEAQGALLVRASAGLQGHRLTFAAEGPGLSLRQEVPAGERASLAFDTAPLANGVTEVACRLLEGEQELAAARVSVRKAPPHPNEVRIDYAGRSLLVDGLPYLPFGFYCHFPVGQLPEVEVPQGFVHIAPYQRTDADPAAVKEYLDRCAALGMRVHYDLRGLAEKESSPEKWAKLRALVEAVRDHPALLCWYLSDEPDGQGIPAQRLEESYRFIKELDPYHPVTMVFCIPAKAHEYTGGMDVMMADPYPIPVRPVNDVASVCDRLNKAVDYGMPLWIVPQAFGGGEWWAREPSAQEERAMTYLAFIHGATGIQYFVRRAPIGNPIAPSLWSECRRLALEGQELAPALLSPEPRPAVQSDAPAVHVAAWRQAGAISVLAANAENIPTPVRIRLAEPVSGKGEVLFAGRSVTVKDGVIEDLLDGLGTRAYRIEVGPRPQDTATLPAGNLVVNPSFEECANTGTPDGCYVSVGKDPGASLFIDPRVAAHGRHSLRLCTPAEGQGVVIRPFPIALKAGKRYRLSVWARGLQDGLKLRFSMAGLDGAEQTFTTTREWAQYPLEGTAPQELKRGQIRLELVSQGTIWLDALQMVPAE